MFPQVGRREVLWDLQRNGGSVAATSERILSGGLERVSFCILLLFFFWPSAGLVGGCGKAPQGGEGREEGEHRGVAIEG